MRIGIMPCSNLGIQSCAIYVRGDPQIKTINFGFALLVVSIFVYI